MAGWQSGYAAACKAVDAGSIPTPAFLKSSCPGGEIGRRKGLKNPRGVSPVPVRLRPRAPKHKIKTSALLAKNQRNHNDCLTLYCVDPTQAWKCS